MITFEAVEQKHPLSFQDRLNWYQINGFLQNFSSTARDLDLAPEAVVHVGGTAQFHRCYQVFGNLSTFHFRGTHDLDLLSFSQGAVQNVLEYMTVCASSGVNGYSMFRSSNFSNKKSFLVDLDGGCDPGLPRLIGMDVFETPNGKITYNGRELSKDKIILDPPETLVDLPLHRGKVVVPSLRDSFLMKMDVVDFSRCGLRIKDIVDLLTTAKVSCLLGVDFEEIVNALILDRREKERNIMGMKDLSLERQCEIMGKLTASLKRKLEYLRAALRSPQQLHHLPLGNPLIPKSHELIQPLKTVDNIGRKVGAFKD